MRMPFVGIDYEVDCNSVIFSFEFQFRMEIVMFEDLPITTKFNTINCSGPKFDEICHHWFRIDYDIFRFIIAAGTLKIYQLASRHHDIICFWPRICGMTKTIRRASYLIAEIPSGAALFSSSKTERWNSHSS